MRWFIPLLFAAALHAQQVPQTTGAIAATASAGITFLTHAEGKNTSGGVTALATNTFSVTGGSGYLIVVACRQDTNNTVPNAPTDSGSNTYTHASAADSSISTTDLLSVWYVANATGFTNGTVQCNWPVSHTFTSTVVRVYKNVGTLDVATNAHSGSGTPTSPSFTTTTAAEAIIAFVSTGSTSQTFTAGSIGGVTATNVFADGVGGSQMTGGEDLIVSGIQTSITATIIDSDTTKAYEISVVSFH